MPSYVSNDGVLYPAKEKVGLINITDNVKLVDGREIQPGEPYVYNGPDRAAEFELATTHGMDIDGKPKITTFGTNFRTNPEFIIQARQMMQALGLSSIDEYLKFIGYDKEESNRIFKEHAAEIVKHNNSTRKPEPVVLGGGTDATGKGNDIVGGFNEERVRTVEDANKENDLLMQKQELLKKKYVV